MSRVRRAKEAWGPEVPDWVLALAAACDRSSQSAVARDLGRSASYVSCLISRSYRGDMASARELVEGRYMARTIACPALGEIGKDVCLGWRRKAAGPFSSVNAERVAMRRACLRCPRFQGSPEADAEAEAETLGQDAE